MSGFVPISLEQCSSWTDNGNKAKIPRSIRAQCPFCGDWAAFNVTAHLDTQSRMATSRSSCPSCSARPQFVLVFADTQNTLADHYPLSVQMYPQHEKSYALRLQKDDLPIPLWRSLEGTVSAFNSRNYAATLSSGRRTLEGIFKYMVEESDRSLKLFDLIEKVISEADMVLPLSRLSDAIRQGGNIGAHFDLESEPDDKMARQLVELLVYLIEYLYVLPKQIQELENAIERPGS